MHAEYNIFVVGIENIEDQRTCLELGKEAGMLVAIRAARFLPAGCMGQA